MKKAIVYPIILIFLSCFLQQILHAMPAYPGPVIFTQPDGTKINISLKGDEKAKWAVTTDGYTVLFNDKGFLEYAELNKNGDLVVSGVIARNPEKRLVEEKTFLSSLPGGFLVRGLKYTIFVKASFFLLISDR